jgi:DNA-binding winged helix-turn-helix (wHTH) protein/tetratricopeptide (TPR) repeat protein
MPHTNLSYVFGPYRLSSSERVLTCDGEIISLSPKATEILILLVANAGKVVEKDDLLREVWPDSFVEDANLSQNIFILRRALGDERDSPRFIETVTRRGYRFIAHVRTCNGNELSSEAVADGSQPGATDEGVAPKPVVAVLPFVNSTADPSVQYLAEGLTDNLINTLSRVSQLRVMSRSAVFRRNSNQRDPQFVGIDLGATAVLVGAVTARPTGTVISVELVDVATGWQLWGESFDCQFIDILQIQDTITRQLLASLKLTLTGEEEKRITARYTESAAAYQAYLEGRYHWSNYTRTGIETAIGHFRQALELDPNYALAYAAIVDCYLRLATNYLPPEDNLPRSMSETAEDQLEARIKLRFTWDWKGVERELRRANELKTDYPSPHQWYVACQLSKQIYLDSLSGTHSSPNEPNAGGPAPVKTEPGKTKPVKTKRSKAAAAQAAPAQVAPDKPRRVFPNDFDSPFDFHSPSNLALQIPSVQLTPTEEVQILCSIARDQMAIGNYEAANLILSRWAIPGKWPKLARLNGYVAADLLLTAGNAFGSLTTSKQVAHGNKHAEVFLSGSAALFEQLGLKNRCVDARVELARCYQRQGLFEIARETISTALSELPEDEIELKTFGLIVWGIIERDCGRLRDSLSKLREAASLEDSTRWFTGICYLDLATTLKELAILEKDEKYLEEAELSFLRALYKSETVGHHRMAGAAENNLGFLLLEAERYEESEEHLLRARRLFEAMSDYVRGAQVDETLARLYLETKQYGCARDVIDRAVATLELTDNEPMLVEALTTKGLVNCRLENFSEGKRSFDDALKVAQRCGDNQGACRALLSMFETIGNRLRPNEITDIANQLSRLLSCMPEPVLLKRIEQAIIQIAATNKSPNQ